MAKVPQMHILRMDFLIDDPPAFAARIPEAARKIMEKPY